MPRCAQCKSKTGLQNYQSNLKYFCDNDNECKSKWGMAQVEKKKAKQRKAYNDVTKGLKKSYGLKYKSDSERATRMEATKKACHLYIRTRDKDKPCICCDLPLGEEFHAGHFKRSNSFGAIKFNEDNIHGQRVDCNTKFGGDRGKYEYNLRNRIGNEKVNDLYEKITNGTRVYKYTIDELKDIEKHYKDMLKTLQSNTG